MKSFESIPVKEFACQPFKILDEGWMLITAEAENRVNTMTASWGGFGIMWGKPVAFMVLRPQRFTKVLLDQQPTFSLSFLPHQTYAKELGYLGTISGYEEDKIEKSGLTVAHHNQTPYFEESEMVMICRKLSMHVLPPSGFLDESLQSTWYPNKDFHYLYISEITDILTEK